MLASYLEEVMVACPVPKALARVLDKAWELLTDKSCLLFNRPFEGKPTRPSANSGEGLLAYPTGIVC